MKSKSDFGKFALVTGSAHRVGKMIALHLAKKGFNIGLHYGSSEDDAIQTGKEIESLGQKAFLLKADISNPDEIDKLFLRLAGFTQTLQVLINSAAIMPKSDLMKISTQEWDKIININLRAVWLFSRGSSAMMNDGGVIINLSDAGSDQHWTGYGAYGISKFALNELTRLMAKQLAPKIRVCGIAPGLLMKSENISQEEWDKLANRVPMKTAGDTSAFFDTLDLLLNNGYITGEIITLNGGATLG